MRSNRLAAGTAALVLACAAGCLNDLSNVAPYVTHIGTTYRLTYAGADDCELWAPKMPGGEYYILPHLPRLPQSKQKGTPLAEGTALRLEAARRGKDADYVLVSLEDPAHPGHRIRASVLPMYLEGFGDDGEANP